jgi:aminoglycoside 3-N-acetyltransferase I
MRTKRLGADEADLARQQFTMMADVFEEERSPLSDRYLEGLLKRPEFWAVAAIDGDKVVGGLTAHTLPMTRSETSEILIYDIAVSQNYQRKGIGRLLMKALREAASQSGIHTVFVPADIEDSHAVHFYRAVGGVESQVALFTF